MLGGLTKGIGHIPIDSTPSADSKYASFFGIGMAPLTRLQSLKFLQKTSRIVRGPSFLRVIQGASYPLPLKNVTPHPSHTLPSPIAREGTIFSREGVRCNLDLYTPLKNWGPYPLVFSTVAFTKSSNKEFAK